MGNQPISKRILVKHPEVSVEQPFYTCLLDMHSIMKTSMVDKRTNSKGDIYGMVFQTLIAIKNILSKRDFQYVYAMYDGDSSGFFKAEVLIDYKSNRDNKNFDFAKVESQYYNEMDKFMKRVLANKTKTTSPEKKQEIETFFEQKTIIMSVLEELCIRQIEIPKLEGDDLIAWYIGHKAPNERIFIVSNDGDLTQLVSDDGFTTQYLKRLDAFITEKNFHKYFNIHHSNVVVEKILCGDQSDKIYGCAGLQKKTLHKIIPEIEIRPITIGEVINRVKSLRQQRMDEKKPPLKVYDNILNQITLGSHPTGKLFEINEKIINLKNPIMSQEGIDELESMMYSPLDPTDRSVSNLYKLIIKYNIDELLDSNKFSSFFSTFAGLRERETKFYEKWMKENS